MHIWDQWPDGRNQATPRCTNYLYVCMQCGTSLRGSDRNKLVQSVANALSVYNNGSIRQTSVFFPLEATDCTHSPSPLGGTSTAVNKLSFKWRLRTTKMLYAVSAETQRCRSRFTHCIYMRTDTSKYILKMHSLVSVYLFYGRGEQRRSLKIDATSQTCVWWNTRPTTSACMTF